MKVIFALILSSLMLALFSGLIGGAIYWLYEGPQWAGWACLCGLGIWLFGFYRLDKKQVGL